MAVPPFDSFLDPFLRELADGQERSMKELVPGVSSRLRLSMEEIAELTAGGRATKVRDRTGWARTYLSKAGLIESERRGRWRISNRGRQLLAGLDRPLQLEDLRQFPEFLEFTGRTSIGNPEAPAESPMITSHLTPRDDLEAAYTLLRRSLEEELLERIKERSSDFFERLVIEVLKAMEYGGGSVDAARVVGQAGDGGIDGLIDEDRLGLDQIYVQAKRWEGGVGGPVLQQFLGALTQRRASKGVIITTSHFTSEALRVAKESGIRIICIDGQKLVRFMTEYGVGVTTEATYKIQKIDGDFFSEDDE